MVKPFNKLTPAEAERLAMLAEEAGEIVQIVGKVLRHGYESKHPDNLDGPNNRTMLKKEVDDLCAIWMQMARCGDVSHGFDFDEIKTVWQRKRKFTHHQETKVMTLTKEQIETRRRGALLRAREARTSDGVAYEMEFVDICNLALEAQGKGFEKVDFFRLAHAFGVPIENVHEATASIGTLFRQRASNKPGNEDD